MKRYLLFLTGILLTGCASYSVERTETGGDSFIEYTYLCPSYSFSNDTPLRPGPLKEHNNISKAGENGQNALNKARQYIRESWGDEFTNKLDLNHLVVTYKDSADVFSKKRLSPYADWKCADIKYCVYLRFTPQPESTYLIAVPLNETFGLTQPLHLPDRKKNPDFDKIITREKAYKIARKKYGALLKDSESITLNYDDNLNSFIWEIDSKLEYIEDRKFEYQTIKVDANTGRIVGTQMKNASGHNTRFF